MSEYSETLKEAGDYRVRLIQDPDAGEPYYDGDSPLLRIYGTYQMSYRDQGTLRDRSEDDAIMAAVQRWGAPHNAGWHYMVKYLRAFFGVTQIETWFSGSYWYVTYDSKAWRDATGAPAGSADMDEYKSYVEGDTWGYVLEKRVKWSAQDPDRAWPDMDTWEDIDSGWGYYGHEYAEESALEAFNAEVG